MFNNIRHLFMHNFHKMQTYAISKQKNADSSKKKTQKLRPRREKNYLCIMYS